MLIERFSAQVLSLGDVKKFLERAEMLGYADRTPIGQTAVGIELYIELPQQAEVFRCPNSSCNKEFPLPQVARNYGSGEWMLPNHVDNGRGFTCKGSGEKGIPVA